MPAASGHPERQTHHPSPWVPAFELVKELATRPATSPRLRGEVGICGSARIPGEGQRRVSQLRNLVQPSRGPSPRPSPRERGEGELCGSAPANARFLHTRLRGGDERKAAGARLVGTTSRARLLFTGAAFRFQVDKRRAVDAVEPAYLECRTVDRH